MNILISADFGGTFALCTVVERQVSPQLLAMMRRSGQNDCGKRQSLVPLYAQDYPEFILSIESAMMKYDCQLPTEGPIVFGGNPGARDQAYDVAERLAKFETKQGRPSEVVSLNREIPCV